MKSGTLFAYVESLYKSGRSGTTRAQLSTREVFAIGVLEAVEVLFRWFGGAVRFWEAGILPLNYARDPSRLYSDQRVAKPAC